MLETKWKRLLALAATAVLCLSGCAEQKTEEGLIADAIMTPAKANYETATVEIGSYEATVSGSASMVFMVETSLYWENSNARYKETLVRSGQEVAAGDVLMTFDVEESEAEMASLELQLRRKREDYSSGKSAKQAAIDKEKARGSALTSYDLEISKLTVEKLQIEYDQYVYKTEREISKIQQQIAEIEEELENTALCAPFDGIVNYVFAGSVGDKVSTSKVLIRIFSTDTILLQVKSGASDLRYNMPVSLEYGKGDKMKTFTGRVVAAPNVLPSGLEQNMTLIKLDQNISRDSVNGALRLSAVNKEVHKIPIVDKSVIYGGGDDTYAYILEDDVVHKRYVTVRKEKGSTVWILDGLSEGQTLILD